MIDLRIGRGVPVRTDDVFGKRFMDSMLDGLDIGRWGVIVGYVPRRQSRGRHGGEDAWRTEKEEGQSWN